MSQRWSIQEIVASLETQAAFHRERQAHHAEQEALHRDKKDHHTAELDGVSRRLEAFRAAAAEAVELAGRVPEGAAAAAEPAEDFGPASNPKLTRIVWKILDGLGGQEPFGPKGVLDEVSRRFGSSLRTLPDIRQISSILHRLQRTGRIHRLRRGRPFHESRYVREAPSQP